MESHPYYHEERFVILESAFWAGRSIDETEAT